MEANYHLPKDIAISFQDLIASYNNPNVGSTEKTEKKF